MRIGRFAIAGPVVVAMAWLSGCNKDSAPTPVPPPPTYTVGGSVSGLTGNLTLSNNGADARTVSANGSFTFGTAVRGGVSYNVTVATQPADQLCAVTAGSGTVGSANITSVSIACETVSGSATVGAAGGTVNGPDGVQVIIPPGALDADTVIRIARATTGVPSLPADVVLDGRVYEITPHDIRFNTEVLVRLPITGAATGDSMFVAEADGSWQLLDAEPASGFSQVARIGFSYFAVGVACTPSPSCVRLSSNLEVDSTPTGAVTRNSSGVGGYVPNVPSMYWTIQEAGAVRLRFRYTTSNNCGAHTLRVARMIYPTPAAPNPRFRVLLERPESPAPFGSNSLHGDVSIDVTNEITEASNEFHVRITCSGAGRERATFGQAVVLGGPMPVPMVNLGGTVSGLAGGGLVLQNPGIMDQSIAANGPFTFGNSVPQGSSYSVTVRTQPANGNCTVSNSSGTALTDVTNIVVSCTSTAPSGGLALVSNNSGVGVSIYRRDSSTGALTSLSSVLSGSNPFSIVVRPDGRFAYASNQGGSSIATFSVDRLAGSLLLVFGAGATVNNPYGIAMDPQGRFLWAVNYSGHSVSSFSIDPTTGALLFSDTTSTALNPYSIAVHPTGNYVYVLNEVGSSTSGGSVSQFRVEPDRGSLMSLGTITGIANRGHSIVITPNGSFAYVLGSNSLSRFTVNSATGELNHTGYTSFDGTSANGADRSLAVHPDGGLLFMSNQSSARMYSINAADGSLTALGQPVMTGSGTSGISLDETGSTLYVVNAVARTVAAYQVDAVAGTLTFVGSEATGDTPMNVTIVP